MTVLLSYCHIRTLLPVKTERVRFTDCFVHMFECLSPSIADVTFPIGVLVECPPIILLRKTTRQSHEGQIAISRRTILVWRHHGNNCGSNLVRVQTPAGCDYISGSARQSAANSAPCCLACHSA